MGLCVYVRRPVRDASQGVPEVEHVDETEELDDVDLPRVVVVDHPELRDHLLLGRLLAAARTRHQLVEGCELGELELA